MGPKIPLSQISKRRKLNDLRFPNYQIIVLCASPTYSLIFELPQSSTEVWD